MKNVLEVIVTTVEDGIIAEAGGLTVSSYVFPWRREVSRLV